MQMCNYPQRRNVRYMHTYKYSFISLQIGYEDFFIC